MILLMLSLLSSHFILVQISFFRNLFSCTCGSKENVYNMDEYVEEYYEEEIEFEPI